MEKIFLILCMLSLVLADVNNAYYDFLLQDKPNDVVQFQKAQYQKIKMQQSPKQQSCLPFYKRLFYNINNVPQQFQKKVIDDIQNEQIPIDQQSHLQRQRLAAQPDNLDMYIYFNTNISCPKSYVTIQIFSTKIMKFDCTEQLLHLQNNGSSWSQYLHKCRILVKQQQSRNVDSFKYTIYGQIVNIQDKQITKLFSQKQIQEYQQKVRISQTYQVQVIKKYIQTKMIVLGDWAPIKIRPYFPIHESLVHYIDLRRNQKIKNPGKNQYRIGALIIAGDIAYNLEDFNGMKYNWFMSQLQRISPYWPIIIFPGNHDDVTPGNRYLLSHSFDIGRLSSEDNNFTRVKWMRFPNLINFIMFDPFLEVYNKGTPQQTSQMTTYLKSTIDQIQNKYPNQFSVIMTHYPIACSQMTDNHCNGMLVSNITKQLLNYMSTQRNGKPRPIDLYIGSHMHQFERVYPYANGIFQIGQKSRYSRGHMVSVVQGAAGCDYGIISQDFPRQNFSVSATYAKTGYAFMTVFGTSQTVDKSQYRINYRHVAAKPGPEYYQDIDQFTIYGKLPQQMSIMQKLISSLSDKMNQIGQQLQRLQISMLVENQ